MQTKSLIKKIAKIVGIVILALILLITVAGVVLRLIFPDERIKRIAEREISKSLNGRKVDIHQANISIFRQINIEDITIYEPNSDSVFVSIDEIDVTYDLTKIIQKKIDIHGISVKKPRVTIVQYSDSLFNFSDLAAPSPPDTAQKKPAKEPPVSVTLSKAELENGEFTFVRLDSTQTAPLMRFRLSGVWANVEGLIVTNPEEIEFELGINPSERNTIFYQKGVVALHTKTDLEVAGEIQNLSKGNAALDLEFDNTDVTLQDKHLENLTAELALDTSFDLEQFWVRVPECVLRFNDEELLKFSLNVRDFDQVPPIMTFDFQPNRINLEKFNPLSEPFAPQISYAGDLILQNIELSGGLDNENPLTTEIELNLENFSFHTDAPQSNVQNLDMKIYVTSSVALDTTNRFIPINIGDSSVKISSNNGNYEIDQPNQYLDIFYSDLSLVATLKSHGTMLSPASSIPISLHASLDSLNISQNETDFVFKNFDFALSAIIKNNVQYIDFSVDTLNLFAKIPNFRNLSVQNTTLTGSVHLDDEFQPEQIRANYLEFTSLGATLSGKNVQAKNPTKPEKMKLSGSLNLQNLSLEELPIPEATAEGIVTAELNFSGKVNELKSDIRLSAENAGYVMRDTIWASDIDVNVEGEIISDLINQNYNFENFSLKIDETMVGRFSGNIDSLKYFRTSIDSLHLQNEKWSDYVPEHLTELTQGLSINGVTSISINSLGEIPKPDSTTTLNPLKLPITADLTLNLRDSDIIYQIPKPAPQMRQGAFSKQVLKTQESPINTIALNGTDAVLRIHYSPAEKSVKLESEIASIDSLTPLEDRSLENISLTLNAKLDTLDNFYLENFAVNIPTFDTSANLKGEILNLNPNQLIKDFSDTTLTQQEILDNLLADIYPLFSGQLFVSPKENALSLPMQSQLTGSTALQFILQREYAEGKIYSANGSFGFENASLKMPPFSFYVNQINGYFPFEYTVDIDGMIELIAGKTPEETIVYPKLRQKRDIDEINYWNFMPYQTDAFEKLHTLRIGELGYDKYEIENIYFNMALADNIFKVKEFGLDLYDGNATGTMLFDPAKGILENMTYQLYAEIAGIDFGKLSGKTSQRGEEEKVFANLYFYGKGVNIETGVDLEGEFNITQIGSKVSERILYLLDPKGTDTSISATKWLIKAGWKPRYFNFRIKHGNLYPSIYMEQPFFAKYLKLFAVPQPIKYRRRPLEFFMEQAKAAKKKTEQ